MALGHFFHTTSDEVGHLTEEEIARGESYISRSKYKVVQIRGIHDESPLIAAYAVASNIGVISESIENSGYFNSFPDVDGTNRWASFVIKFGENFYPSLPFAVLEHYLDRAMLSLTMAQYGVKGRRCPRESLYKLIRCGELKGNPPPAGWDGVYTMTKK